MNLPKKQGQRLIPEYLLKYNEELRENHPDPTAEWGGGGVPIVDVSTYVMQGTALPDDIYNEIINNNPYIKYDLGNILYYHLVGDWDQYLIFEYTNEIGSGTYGTDPDISEVEFMRANRLKLDKTTKIMSYDFNSGYRPLLTVNDTPSANVKVLKNIKLGGGSTTTYEIPTPTVVSANTGATPTATLTDLQVGSTVYEVPQGGDEIDNKTIVKNQDDELETAIGGWKEIEEVYFAPTMTGSNADWDLVDATLASQMFNSLEANVEYDVTVSVTGTTIPEIGISRAYIVGSKTTTRYGGDNVLKIVDNNNVTHNMQFYVDISTNKIHVYPGGSSTAWIKPTNGSTMTLTFADSVTFTTYHPIDANYLPDITSKIRLSNQDSLYLNPTSNTLRTDFASVSPLAIGYSSISESSTATAHWKCNYRLNFDGSFKLVALPGSGNTKNTLSSALGGGFADYFVLTPNVDYTLSGNIGTLTNQTFIDGCVNALINNYNVKSIQCKVSYRDSSDNVLSNWSFTSGVYRSTYTADNYYLYYSGSSASPSPLYIEVKKDMTTGALYDPVVKISSNQANLDHINIEFKNSETSTAYEFGIVKQVDKKFIPLVSEIPTVDTTTDGTYVLKATVSSGVVTYAWVLES